MMKRFVSSGVALLGLLAVSAVSANAAYYEFDVKAKPLDENVSVGSWRVILQSTDAVTWGFSIQAFGVPDVPGADAHKVSFSIFDGLSGLDPLGNKIDVTGANATTVPLFGAVNPNPWAWTTENAPGPRSAQLQQLSPFGGFPGAGEALKIDGTNQLVGSFTLGTAVQSGAIRIGIDNNTQTWGETVRFDGPNMPGDLTPEGSGAAALLPALLPIGLVALKRRKANKKEAAAA